MKVQIICSVRNRPNIDIELTSDVCVPDGIAYFISSEISLEDYAQEWKNKVRVLERRYSYLERARGWIIKNIRGVK